MIPTLCRSSSSNPSSPSKLIPRWVELLFVCFSLFFFSAACQNNSSRNVVFLVDTSGSMQEASLIEEVKQNIALVLQSYHPGDWIQIVTFDGEPRTFLNKVLQSEEEKQTLLRSLQSVQANGKWTDLVAVLDHSLAEIVEIRKSNPDRKTTLVVYTDGKQDPPPGKSKAAVQSFQDLIERYYKNYQKGESWFIYYVELNEPEPALQEFLQQTESGKTVSRGEFESGRDFTLPSPGSWKTYLLRAGGALLSLLLFLYLLASLLPWFGNFRLVPTGTQAGSRVFHLQDYPKKKWRRGIYVGSEGEIKLRGGQPRSAFIGLNFKGDPYIRPIGKAEVRVSGTPVTGKQYLAAGMQIEIEGKTFLFSPSRP